MIQEFIGVGISAMSTCVPENVISNDYFSELFSPKERRVFEKTVGIIERRWSESGVTACDIGYKAGLDLLSNYDVDKDEIDCLIFLSQTPDYKLPFTSNLLQDRLGLRQNILCLDISAGCAGFIQGLSTSFSIAKTLNKGKVLFIVAETLSKFLSEKDRSTSTLFGDGGAALLIENTNNPTDKSFFNFYSDGSNADAIKIPDGGFRNPVTKDSFTMVEDEKGNVKNRLQLSMDGPRVFDFTLREIAPSIIELLDFSKIEKESVDYFMLHQSNQLIIKQISAQLGVPLDKMLLNINKFGNTSGVSIPLLMASFAEEMKSSNNIVLTGYGVGLNWGNCVITNLSINYIGKTEL